MITSLYTKNIVFTVHKSAYTRTKRLRKDVGVFSDDRLTMVACRVSKSFLIIPIYRVYKKKVIELCSTLARSLYNLQKSFFRRRKDQAFSFRLSSFLCNLKKDWAITNQMKIAG